MASMIFLLFGLLAANVLVISLMVRRNRTIVSEIHGLCVGMDNQCPAM
jgi:hypothetical protein